MWRLLAGIACVAFVSPAYAADELAFGPVPGWVEFRPVAAGPQGESPIEILLIDSQAKLEGGQSETYSHTAVRINDAQGLSAGNVVAIWDPAFETVTIHKVIIRRGNQQIDVLGKGQKFAILRREQNLEQQTLDGRLTATLQPEGLQIGDILETETSVVRRDPTLRGHMEMIGRFGFPMRVENAQLRLVTPAKSEIRQRVAGGMPAPAVSRKGNEKLSVWALGTVLPEQSPAFAPPRFADGKTVDVTDFQSWNELSALFLPLFEQASTIAADSPLQQEIARIKAASPDPVKRAELALQLVEQKVRYVNLALGVGGLVPASVNQTWDRRFGDCKAKSALLVGLLHALGIDATPVLVHSENGDGLNEHLPMVGLFNHVIVRSSIGGQTYWLDGTRSGDVTLKSLKVPYYHWGLPIVQNADLVRIVPGPLVQPSIENIIHTDASAGADKPVPTTIDITLRGDLAITQNLLLSAQDPSLRDQTIRKMLQGALDQFEVEKVSTRYDPANQVYQLHGEGRQTLDLDDGIYWTEIPTPGYKADFRRSGTRDQDAPVEISYPLYNRNIQVITLPRDMAKGRVDAEPINTTIAGMEYRRNVTNSGGVVTIESSTRSLVPEIPYAEAVAAQDGLRSLNKENMGLRFSNTIRVAAADVKEMIGHDPKTPGDYVDAALKLLDDEGNAPKAMGALDKALEISPTDFRALALRAPLRMSLGDLDGSKADALAILKASPKNGTMRLLLAEIYRKEGNFDAAYAQAESLAKIDNAHAQVTRGQILDILGRPQEALAAFALALKFDRDPMIHVNRAKVIPAADKAARRRELDAALKLKPSDAPALAELGDLASQLGDHEQALELLDQAFLKRPDDLALRHARAVQLMLAGKKDSANREFDALAGKDLDANELNELCWTKALANVALERALDECDRALAKSESSALHDSKATVLLRQARFDEAIKEFDVALQNGEFAASLYGRSLAYAAKGDLAKSNADAAKALELSPDVARTYAYHGFTR